MKYVWTVHDTDNCEVWDTAYSTFSKALDAIFECLNERGNVMDYEVEYTDSKSPWIVYVHSDDGEFTLTRLKVI